MKIHFQLMGFFGKKDAVPAYESLGSVAKMSDRAGGVENGKHRFVF